MDNNNYLFDSSLISYNPQPKKLQEIDSSFLNYTKPKDDVTLIKENPNINNYEKIDKIKELLVNKYRIIDGDFAYMLAATAVNDKKIIKSIIKQQKKMKKKRKKKRK